MKDTNNEQEQFWAGEFGDGYIQRNKSASLLAANLQFFSTVISKLDRVNSVTEFGCNIGMNFLALKQLLPDAELKGIEINHKAAEFISKEQPYVKMQVGSILEKINSDADLTFTKGVLIHIHPSNLDQVYENLYNNSNRYILIAEYYNSVPVSLDYRGHKDKLFKRDFAGELLDRYKDLELLDYGFLYHRDPNFPQDDISWFLLEKVN